MLLWFLWHVYINFKLNQPVTLPGEYYDLGDLPSHFLWGKSFLKLVSYLCSKGSSDRNATASCLTKLP